MQLKSWPAYTNTKQLSMKILGQHLGKKDIIHLIPRLIIVLIIGQTIPFKFMGAEESKWIFEQIGWEPWGRLLIASIETTAVIFLISRYYIFGAIISLSLISAANLMHFLRLGIEVNGDGGALFVMSIIVIICSLIVVIHWNRMRSKASVKHFDYEVEVEEEV